MEMQRGDARISAMGSVVRECAHEHDDDGDYQGQKPRRSDEELPLAGATLRSPERRGSRLRVFHQSAGTLGRHLGARTFADESPRPITRVLGLGPEVTPLIADSTIGEDGQQL